jgi:hypothetical protein
MRLSAKLMATSLLILTAGAPVVHAAANAAKNPAQPAPRLTRGWVVSVQRGNGQRAFLVRIPNANANLGGMANPAAMGAQLPPMQTFNVVPGTQFEAVQGVNRLQVGFSALRPGQRVVVQSQGQVATGVRIVARGQNVGSVRRGRYLPKLHAARTPGALGAVPTAASSSKTAQVSPSQSVNRNVPAVPIAHSAPRVAAKKR